MESTMVVKQSKIGEGKRALIVSTACVGGEYETLVMKSDYRDIDGGRYKSEEDALKAHDDFYIKYSSYGKVDEVALRDAKLPTKYVVLTAMLTMALQIAKPMLDTEDGGTCNFDALMMYLPKWREDYTEEAARRAGMSASTRNGWGKKSFVFGYDMRGRQGNARTRFAEAMARAMKEYGYDACVYYQMD